MTTIEVNILADDDQEFVITILDALAQKRLIEFNVADSYPAEGPGMSREELVARVEKAERGKRYSHEEARKRLGL